MSPSPKLSGLTDAPRSPDAPRGLTQAERARAAPVFRGALNLDAVRIVRKRWWPLQPRNVVMTPRGCIHIAANAPFSCDCFASQRPSLQALLIHELVHVWQHQQGVNLMLRRPPWSRYDYAVKPGWMLERYGIEQQAMIVQHVFTLRHGGRCRALRRWQRSKASCHSDRKKAQKSLCYCGFFLSVMKVLPQQLSSQ